MINHVTCPVYIFHGEMDEVVPVIHSKLLAKNAKTLFSTWWVEGAGHNDIDSKFRKTYFTKLS